MKKLLCLLLFPTLVFAAGSTSNTLTWDYGTYDLAGNPKGITATLIWRKAEACTGSLPFAQIASVPFPTLTYDDASIKQGVTYCYEAQSQNPAGVSATFSNLVAKTVPFAIPDAPANLIVK